MLMVNDGTQGKSKTKSRTRLLYSKTSQNALTRTSPCRSDPSVFPQTAIFLHGQMVAEYLSCAPREEGSSPASAGQMTAWASSGERPSCHFVITMGRRRPETASDRCGIDALVSKA